jgi:hypothetical protein
VQRSELPADLPIYQVAQKKLLELAQGSEVYESPYDFSVVLKDAIFRHLKKGKPEIVKCERFELNPDHAGVKVTVSKKEIFRIAKIGMAMLFETKEFYLLPTEPIIMAEKKPKT